MLGPVLAYEVLTAFFLEAGFLGVMLFGLNRVGQVRISSRPAWSRSGRCFRRSGSSRPIHGCTRQPAIRSRDGHFMPENCWRSSSTRLSPTASPTRDAAYLTTALIVGAVGAWHLLRDTANPRARVMFSMAMWMAAVVAPAQLVSATCTA